jgi:hypothetical protein
MKSPRTRRRATRLAVGAAVAAMVTVLSASPALAHGGGLEGFCESTQVCNFKDNNFGGGIKGWAGNVPNYASSAYGHEYDWCNFRCGSLNDTASSIDNDGESCGSSHWRDKNYGGRGFWMPRGDHKHSLSADKNDELSSHRWCS